MSTLPNVDPKWNRRYEECDTPWDMGIPSRELSRVLQERLVTGRTALELGCGTGTNAIFLAAHGFEVTAIDGAPLAIARARDVATQHNVRVNWVEGDVCAAPDLEATYDLIFDRGCFHCVRLVNLPGYLETLRRFSHPGTRLLLLTGNAHETREGGPPRLTEEDLRRDLEPLFVIDYLHPFRFDNPEGPTGPLGWSCLMTRRG